MFSFWLLVQRLVNESISPPKIFCPAPVEKSFEQAFSDKLHNQLVLRKNSSTNKSNKSSSTEAKKVSQASAAQLSSMVNNARAALGNRELANALHNVDKIIVQGTKKKRWILQEYKEILGADYSDSIVTKKKGNHSYIDPDWPIIHMKLSIKKYYRVEKLAIYNVITTGIKEF